MGAHTHSTPQPSPLPGSIPNTTTLQAGIAVSATGMYATDQSLHRLQKFDLTGTFLWAMPPDSTTQGSGDGQVTQPLSRGTPSEWLRVAPADLAVWLLPVRNLHFRPAVRVQFSGPLGVAVGTNVLINGSVVEEVVYVVSRPGCQRNQGIKGAGCTG